MRLLREPSRRKLRTTLTIVGITIGIWSLVVFSSLANRLNSFVDAGSGIYAGKIIVAEGESFGTSPMPLTAADDIGGLGRRCGGGSRMTATEADRGSQCRG